MRLDIRAEMGHALLPEERSPCLCMLLTWFLKACSASSLCTCPTCMTLRPRMSPSWLSRANSLSSLSTTTAGRELRQSLDLGNGSPQCTPQGTPQQDCTGARGNAVAADTV